MLLKHDFRRALVSYLSNGHRGLRYLDVTMMLHVHNITNAKLILIFICTSYNYNLKWLIIINNYLIYQTEFTNMYHLLIG